MSGSAPSSLWTSAPGPTWSGTRSTSPGGGGGYGTEACEFLVYYAFTILGAFRLNGDCAAGNTGSVRVMEKCGFVREGRQRRYWHARGGYHDRLLFGLLREDLEKRHLTGLEEHIGWKKTSKNIQK